MLHYILLADQTLFSDCFYLFEMLDNKRGFLFKIGPGEPNLGSGEYKKAEYLGGFRKAIGDDKRQYFRKVKYG